MKALHIDECALPHNIQAFFAKPNCLLDWLCPRVENNNFS